MSSRCWKFSGVVLLFALLLVQCEGYGQDGPCCWKTSGSCRTACEQVLHNWREAEIEGNARGHGQPKFLHVCWATEDEKSRVGALVCEASADGANEICAMLGESISLAAVAADPDLREERLQNLYNFCPEQLMQFWECMNETLDEIRKGEEWSGRQCCSLPQSGRCQRACVTATSRRELTQSCRHSDELNFFTCLDRQEFGEECCTNARSVDCYSACRMVFRTMLTPSSEIRNAVTESCSVTSPKVIHCIKNFTKLTPATNVHKSVVHCCEKTEEPKCRESCKRILKTKTTGQEIVDSLQGGGCGPPLPHDRLWQCFLQTGNPSENSASNTEVSRIDRMGMDSAKLHCCNKATSSVCRRLCIKTYSDEWTKSWKDFDKECLSQLAEDELVHCLDEIEEPCELNCDGLGYCTNFNNRPTELFRSCNFQADEAARYDVALWQQQGFLSLPGGIQILVRNISKCSPNMWKAVACALQIKPCHRQTHANRICREDCYEMLSQCMDWSRMSPGQTAASICSKLAFSEKPSSPCISLKPFLEPSDTSYAESGDQVTAPCRGDPCDPDEICLINRNCAEGQPCQPYICVPGCKMGEVSQYMVPHNSYVRIPLPTENKGCQKICHCSIDGTIERCQPMPCVPADSCWLGNKKIEHGSSFFLDCNVCSCLSGEITCSKKQCEVTSIGFRDSSFTSLPCNCPPHHVPVCGRNGNTYPSSCLAKCAGLRDADFEFGPCSAKDPCEPDPCGDRLKCVIVRKVCLSLLEKPCKQHMCVDLSMPCSEMPRDAVCDTEQREHSNLCYLVRAGKTFAYKGPCLVDCRTDGSVCGIDGETYPSECAAKANHVLVDYRGPCLVVGLISEGAKPQCGPAVACQPLPATGCYAVTPPGACCPICAGALRLLYSRKQVDRALYALRGNPTNALTIAAILASLERQLQIAECSLKGFLTVELDIFVAVVPRKQYSASELQREVCVREAEKLASLVRRSSPRILSELGLSSLTAATLVHVMASGELKGAYYSFWLLVPLLLLLHFIA